MRNFKDASFFGDTQYLGKPCKKAGHVGVRFVSNMTCAACIGEAQKAPKRKEQLKDYRQRPHAKAYQQKYQKEYAKTSVYKEQKHIYSRNNTAKLTAKTRKYQTSKLKRTPKWLSVDDFWLIEQAYDLAQLRTQIFGFQWHVDHIVPLQGGLVSGLHVPHNLQVIPAADNQSKANKFAPT